MPRSAHRRCKEQGPTCHGVAHPGHDVCTRCMHDVVRPREREERRMMRQRKAMRLAPATRALINEVDLQEPQMRPLSDVIIDGLIERDIDRIVADGKDPVEVLSDQILKMDLDRIPVLEIRPTASRKSPPKEEPKRIDMPIEPYSVRSRGRGAPPLAPETEQEIVEAYAAGMPTKEIARAYSIGTTSLYRLVRDAGLTTRNGKEPQVPTPPASTPPVSAPSPNGSVAPTSLTEWVVTLVVQTQVQVTVAAKTFNDAANAALDHEDVRGHYGLDREVLSVARKKS